MSRVNRFQQGTGCFVCESCGHRTRKTTTDCRDSAICDLCFELAGMENGASDRGEEAVKDYLREATDIYMTITGRGGHYEFWTELGDAVLAEVARRNSTPKDQTHTTAGKKILPELAPAGAMGVTVLFGGAFYRYYLNDANPPSEPVEERNGRHYIKMGFAGFNTPRNNANGYTTRKAALCAILFCQRAK